MQSTTHSARLSARDSREGAVSVSHTVVFKRLVERLEQEQTTDVIDLARVIETNVEFLLERKLRLHYPDFTNLLREMRQEQGVDADASAAKAEQQLDDEGYVFIDGGVAAEESAEVKLPVLFPELTEIDCVLVWDLLQYLNRPEVTELSRKLAAAMQRGGLLYLVNSTHAKIAMEPMRCTIEDESHIRFSGCDAEEWISPGYSQREIIDMMPEFKMKHATLLQNGLQEMLLQRC